MPRWQRPSRPPAPLYAAIISLSFALLGFVRPASAQFGGGGTRPGAQPGAGNPAPQDTKEGPAEVSPDDKAESPALQPLPAWPQQREKASQFFQLNGYLRFRAYLFHNLNLGYYEGSSGPRSPFFIPFSEFGQSGKVSDMGAKASAAQRDQKDGRTDNLTSADMRLRLEPTINVTDQDGVAVVTCAIDNLIKGGAGQAVQVCNVRLGLDEASGLVETSPWP